MPRRALPRCSCLRFGGRRQQRMRALDACVCVKTRRLVHTSNRVAAPVGVAAEATVMPVGATANGVVAPVFRTANGVATCVGATAKGTVNVILHYGPPARRPCGGNPHLKRRRQRQRRRDAACAISPGDVHTLEVWKCGQCPACRLADHDAAAVPAGGVDAQQRAGKLSGSHQRQSTPKVDADLAVWRRVQRGGGVDGCDYALTVESYIEQISQLDRNRDSATGTAQQGQRNRDSATGAATKTALIPYANLCRLGERCWRGDGGFWQCWPCWRCRGGDGGGGGGFWQCWRWRGGLGGGGGACGGSHEACAAGAPASGAHAYGCVSKRCAQSARSGRLLSTRLLTCNDVQRTCS
eukprot:357111-Chlamydomonas_euryale.AAC.5